ncbi:hypothetical protein [Dyella ginsengisoli]
MGKLMDESDFNPRMARARREEAACELESPGADNAPAPNTLSEEH